MIVLDVEQGSPEWEMARLAIPTCSGYERILTPAKLQPSKQARPYMLQLLAEYIVGHAIDWSGRGAFMDRGTNMEAEARSMYELETGRSVQVVGFIYRDAEHSTGGSPDSLVGDAGGLEIKCPAIHTHIGYMLDSESLAEQYRMQTQGYMHVTGREWWDIYAYHPDLPAVSVRIGRDNACQQALEGALDVFCRELAAAKAELAPHRLPSYEAAREAALA